MSPASSGALEVERYIGACLISSQRHQGGNGRSTKRYDYYVQPPGDVVFRQQQKYNSHSTNNAFRRCHSVDGWAGGIPLISFANPNNNSNHHHQRRSGTVGRKQDAHHDGLTRLAVHTQGAPLILSHQKYSGNGRRSNTNNSSSNVRKSNQSVDAASVTSDESTGTGNSETTALPRIIKPRKRRKKDRKPLPHLLQTFSRHDDGLSSSTDSGSPDIASLVVDLMVAPYFPVHHPNNRHHQQRTLLNYSDNLTNDSNVTGCTNDISETPKLHHRFEDVEVPKDEDPKEMTTSCQCTYCNPADQIWDVSKNNDCYSPFLTTPTFCFDSSTRLITDAMSSVSLDDEDDEVVTRRKNVESSTRNFIEISTEIVTSPNGHRDLEIKLFPSNDKGVGAGGGVVREVNNNNSTGKCLSEACCDKTGTVIGNYKGIMHHEY
ncbi:uncharacterized protein LOC108738807 [Agrilus planipennis]|uniref:Uncharacterized protein LOC108738807 n=1 Tax=Agrilus planipennis TaxID=224129 RepID=A0A1W4X6E0_AGRPL|nr:uncharacterized protein LOC108738807 [Agrilus planipennis]